jgi:hypothetical protein
MSFGYAWLTPPNNQPKRAALARGRDGSMSADQAPLKLVRQPITETCASQLQERKLPERAWYLTEVLQRAMPAIEELPAEEQGAFATRILAELADEQAWTARFNATTDEQWDGLAETVTCPQSLYHLLC